MQYYYDNIINIIYYIILYYIINVISKITLLIILLAILYYMKTTLNINWRGTKNIKEGNITAALKEWEQIRATKDQHEELAAQGKYLGASGACSGSTHRDNTITYTDDTGTNKPYVKLDGSYGSLTECAAKASTWQPGTPTFMSYNAATKNCYVSKNPPDIAASGCPNEKHYLVGDDPKQFLLVGSTLSDATAWKDNNYDKDNDQLWLVSDRSTAAPTTAAPTTAAPTPAPTSGLTSGLTSAPTSGPTNAAPASISSPMVSIPEVLMESEQTCSSIDPRWDKLLEYLEGTGKCCKETNGLDDLKNQLGELNEPQTCENIDTRNTLEGFSSAKKIIREKKGVTLICQNNNSVGTPGTISPAGTSSPAISLEKFINNHGRATKFFL